MPHPLYALPAVRERRHLTTDGLAKRANITLPTLRRLERGGMPTFATTHRLAAALRVQPHTLMHVNMTWRRAWVECADCQADKSR